MIGKGEMFMELKLENLSKSYGKKRALNHLRSFRTQRCR